MAHPTRVKSKKQVPARSAGIVAREGEFSLLEIFDGKRPAPDYYFLKSIPSDWGTAFQLEKQDDVGLAEVYHVCLAGHDSTCDCKGFCYYQKPCKHILGLQALTAAGRVPAAAPAASQPRLQEVGDNYRCGFHDEPSFEEAIFG